jgi:hypothetical protein
VSKKAIERDMPVEELQHPLFEDNEEAWREEWVGMPEFVQGKREPYATIIMRFSSEEDLQEFAAKIGQKLNRKSQCSWYPELVPGINRDKKYVDES